VQIAESIEAGYMQMYTDVLFTRRSGGQSIDVMCTRLKSIIQMCSETTKLERTFVFLTSGHAKPIESMGKYYVADLGYVGMLNDCVMAKKNIYVSLKCVSNVKCLHC